MVIGDVVMSTKIRPYENATITKVDISIHEKTNKKGIKRKETRTSYTATFADGTSFIFYGFNINKSVFKVVGHDGQITLWDFMNPPIVD